MDNQRGKIGGIPSAAILLGLLLIAAAVTFYQRLPTFSAASLTDSKPAIPLTGVKTNLYVAADTNIRNRATSIGTQINAKLARGAQIDGVVELGENGNSHWFRLSDGSGFVSVINLSQSEPPALTQSFASPSWRPARDTDLHVTPDPSGTIVAVAYSGRRFAVTGVTANNFVEVKLDEGGVGYANLAEINQ